jgi:hypothetical protein
VTVRRERRHPRALLACVAALSAACGSGDGDAVGPDPNARCHVTCTRTTTFDPISGGSSTFVSCFRSGCPPAPPPNAEPHAAIDAENGAHGRLVRLSGAGSSDPEGEPLGYHWAFAFAPNGTSAVLPEDQAEPAFVPDRTGRWVVSLVVDDGERHSSAARATVLVESADHADYRLVVARAGEGLGRSWVADVADLNGDGHADLVVGAQDPFLRVVLGRAGGSGVATVLLTSAAEIQGLTLADFDEDGDIDAVAGNLFLAGDGAGGFEELGPVADVTDVTDVLKGDFNGDGHVDAVLLQRASGNGTVLHGDGAGGFAVAYEFGYAYNVVTADLDGDGLDDLVYTPAGAVPVPRVAVVLGAAGGSYREVLQSTVGSNPILGLGDVTLDGVPDLVQSYFIGGSGSVQPMLAVQAGLGDGSFGSGRAFATATFAEYGIAFADMDRDGDDDVVFLNGARNAALDDDVLAILENRLEGRDFRVTTLEPLPPDVRSAPVVTDLDGDGLPDLLLPGMGTVWVALGKEQVY